MGVKATATGIGDRSKEGAGRPGRGTGTGGAIGRVSQMSIGYTETTARLTLGDSKMTIPVMVHPARGLFEAFVVGAPDMNATASTREEALSKLETAISKRVEQGELVMLDVPPRGLASVFGAFRDDPTLQQICDEAYRLRDAEIQE
jgi:hypothetical protein